MKVKLADVNVDAETKLPPHEKDGSQIGVNYTDLYLKPMNTELDDGRKVTCKRKGLKITFTLGDQQGEAIMRRIENGPDPKNILQCALTEAARAAGASLHIDDEAIYLTDVPN